MNELDFFVGEQLPSAMIAQVRAARRKSSLKLPPTGNFSGGHRRRLGFPGPEHVIAGSANRDRIR